MIPYFRELGERVEAAWLARGYDEDLFPSLVLEILASSPPHERVGLEEIADWVFDPHPAFRQPSGQKLFGEPPVMLYQGPRFYIEALYWFSGTTEIHEHAFSGAFAVLAGSSVHSHWRFTPYRHVNSRMRCGRLDRVSTEILTPGGMRPIDAGDRLIHQLFHLELPSVTIVVRTYGDRHRLPQLRYMPPGLAIDTDDFDPNRARRILLLDGMARGHMEGLRKYALRLLGEGDLESVFHALSTLTRGRVEADLVEELFWAARERHGEIVNLFREVCDWEKRLRRILALRAKVTDGEARFLLALLMLMPDRASIFETVRLRCGEADPLETIEGWLAGIAGKETIGFDFTDVNRAIFRGLVRGLDPEGILSGLREEFRDESVDDHRDRLLGHARQLASSNLFQPLFSESPLRGGAPSRWRS